ncbi:MAG: TfoX/Sxy family protein [Gemmatimonadaceae bacterium]
MRGDSRETKQRLMRDENDSLARRIRASLARLGGVEEKRMFGGLAFMVDGKMCVTVRDERIMLRIDPADHDAAVARPGCEPMVMRGREIRGYVRVGASALRTHAAFDRWMRMAIEYNPRAPRRR